MTVAGGQIIGVDGMEAPTMATTAAGAPRLRDQGIPHRVVDQSRSLPYTKGNRSGTGRGAGCQDGAPK